MSRSKVKVTGDKKNEKVRNLFLERLSGRGYAGGKISARCLVLGLVFSVDLFTYSFKNQIHGHQFNH